MPGPQRSNPAPARTVIPKLVTSPTWSLQPWPLTITVGGDLYTIPAHPAVVWLDPLMEEGSSWLDIFPGLAEGDAEEALVQAVIDDRLDGDELTTVAKEILALASARPWWVTIRLVNVAVSSWDYIGGEIILKGVDASRLSLAAWLDAVFHIILRAMDQKDHTRFLAALEAPPPEEVANVPEPEISAADFGALMR